MVRRLDLWKERGQGESSDYWHLSAMTAGELTWCLHLVRVRREEPRQFWGETVKPRWVGQLQKSGRCGPRIVHQAGERSWLRELGMEVKLVNTKKAKKSSLVGKSCLIQKLDTAPLRDDVLWLQPTLNTRTPHQDETQQLVLASQVLQWDV